MDCEFNCKNLTMNGKQKKCLYFKTGITLSLILHAFIATIFIVHFNSLPLTQNNFRREILSTYLYYEKSHSKKTSYPLFNANSAKLSFNKTVNKKQAPKDKNTNTVEKALNLAGTKHAELLAKLHDLIQQNVFYPKEILNADKKLLTVAFILQPDGRIYNTEILHPSGIAILDAAVLSAITELKSITFAAEYLTQSDEFSVDIEFQK